MSNQGVSDADGRILVLAATGKDASLTQTVLSAAGLQILICTSFDTMMNELRSGAAAVLIAEETLSWDHTGALARFLAAQPTWSDLPILVLTRHGADSAELDNAVKSLGNVTLLERPLRVGTLRSAAKTARRARDRQYQIRGHLEERANAENMLRTSDRRKDEFLATLGHELRNPLAPLATGIHLLKAIKHSDPSMHGLIGVMDRQVLQLTRLVDDLLEVSRITRGVIEIRREPVDLRLALQSSIETVRPSLEAAGHQLDVRMPQEPVTVEGDVVRLTQVFANLLGNASKYTGRGGRVSLTLSQNADRAIVSVRDTGIGIPPDQLTAVFEMFTQVDRASRRSQGGLGIGLTLVKSLVTMHGGRVEARSSGLGDGSEFIVELPVIHVALPEVHSQPSIDGLPPCRILVVDDNADAAETLGALLETLGATVVVSHSGREALEAIGSFNPDAVLLDIGMPGMDGYEVARRLRASLHSGDLLLIALTGWGQEHDHRRSRAAGFDHHLVKPPDIEILRRILKERWVRPRS